MKILVDVVHPAHVHLFKNLIWKLQKRGHEIIITSREKDVTNSLLDEYGFEYYTLSRAQKGLFQLFKELIVRDVKLLNLVTKLKPALLLGTSAMITHISRITPTRSIMFEEDDADAIKIIASLAYPFAHVICTPDCLRETYGKKHVKYRGYHELAYLHPRNFSPDSTILRRIGLNLKDKFFILRFISLGASHDAGQAGLSLNMKKLLISELKKQGQVLITSEGHLSPEFEKYRVNVPLHELHSLLYYAAMFIGDSQTMTAEAAVLGTPSIRCNTFVGRLSYLEELEHKYGLTYGFLPKDEDKMFAKVLDLLKDNDLKEKWQQRRRLMLKDKIDVAEWMVNFVESYGNGMCPLNTV